MRIFKILLICILCIGKVAVSSANPGLENTQSAYTKTDKYIKYVYDKISFKKINRLSFEAFSKAFYGYLNLKEALPVQ